MEEHFRHKISKYSGRICYIPNWGDAELIFPDNDEGRGILQKFGISDKFVFQYAGNLGRAQGMQYILYAASKLNGTGSHFLFFGDGVFKNEVKRHAEILENVTYGGVFNRLESQKYTNACDVAIVTLLEGIAGLGVPSKTSDIMAAGKPILFIGEKKSEIARIIEEGNIGLVVNPNSSDEIINAVKFFLRMSKSDLQDMSLRARKMVEDRYSDKIIMEKYRRELEEFSNG
jgi:glycosyltransferase involved in cell wall biosynthesis